MDALLLTSWINFIKGLFVDYRSDVIALVALGISIYALRKHSKLQRSGSEWHNIQLKQIHEEKTKTTVTVEYNQESDNNGIFTLYNTGKVDAKCIIFRYADIPNFGYLGISEFHDNDGKKVKVPILHPSSSSRIKVFFGKVWSVEVFWSWENPDGSRSEEKYQCFNPYS